MIHVSRTRAIRQVQYLIHQSLQGNHVLFDAEELKAALAPLSQPSSAPSPTPLSEEELYGLEPLLERLLDEPTLESKRAFLESLDRETTLQIIRVYFNVVENSLLEAQNSKENLH